MKLLVIFVQLILIANIKATENVCPKDWANFDKNCYWLGELKNEILVKKCSAARDECKKQGANLATINSMEEGHFVSTTIVNRVESIRGNFTAEVWINSIRKENSYNKAISVNRNLNYSHSTISKKLSGRDNINFCVTLSLRQQNWERNVRQFRNCNLKFPFICKKSVTTSAMAAEDSLCPPNCKPRTRRTRSKRTPVMKRSSDYDYDSSEFKKPTFEIIRNRHFPFILSDVDDDHNRHNRYRQEIFDKILIPRGRYYRFHHELHHPRIPNRILSPVLRPYRPSSFFQPNTKSKTEKTTKFAEHITTLPTLDLREIGSTESVVLKIFGNAISGKPAIIHEAAPFNEAASFNDQNISKSIEKNQRETSFMVKGVNIITEIPFTNKLRLNSTSPPSVNTSSVGEPTTPPSVNTSSVDESTKNPSSTTSKSVTIITNGKIAATKQTKDKKKAITLSQHGCDFGDAHLDNHCYHGSSRKETWISAKDICETVYKGHLTKGHLTKGHLTKGHLTKGHLTKGHLTVINERREYNFLKEIGNNLELNPAEPYWIGIKTENISKISEIQWINGEIVTFPFWWEIDFKTSEGDCGVTNFDAENPKIFGVRNCSLKLDFICEYNRNIENENENAATSQPSIIREMDGNCLKGWNYDYLRKICYKIYTNPVRFVDAVELCQKEGGLMEIEYFANAENVDINSLEVHDALLQGRLNIFWSGYYITENGIWAKNDVLWEELSSGFKSWNQTAISKNSNCVTKGPRGLNYSNCENKYPFMCEVKPSYYVTKVTTIIPLDEDVPCPNDYTGKFIRRGDLCYRFVSMLELSPQNWMEAKFFCQLFDAKLVSIQSEEENVWIHEKIKAFHDDYVWTGGRYLYGKTFFWDDLTEFNYTNWDKGEPNNVNDMEDCVSMLTKHPLGQWNDNDCLKKAGFVCKRPVLKFLEPEVNIETTTQLDKEESSSTIHPFFQERMKFLLNRKTVLRNGGCPEEWYKVENKCIRMVTGYNGQNYTFKIAETECRKLAVGGGLISIHSDKQQAAVMSLLQYRRNAWIGLHYSSVIRNFLWTDGSTVTYKDENKDLFMSYMTGDGSCFCLASDNDFGSWRIRSCENGLPAFACQAPLDPNIVSSPLPFHKRCETPHQAFYAHNDNCYAYVEKPETWDEATITCHNMKAQLLTISNVAEQSFVWTQFSTLSQGEIWTGLKRVGHNFVWADSWPFLYTNWGLNQPDGQGHCVTLLLDDGEWRTSQCNETRTYVCMISDHKINTTNINNTVKGRCPSEQWTDLGGDYCYYVNAIEKLSWVHAAMRCKLMKGELTAIHSDEEMNNLNKVALRSHDSFWIGLLKMSNGGFGWVDGSIMDYENWNEDLNWFEDWYKEDCVEMNFGSGKWKIHNCDGEKAFICKAPKISKSSKFESSAGHNSLLVGEIPTHYSLASVIGISLLTLLIGATLGVASLILFNKKKCPFSLSALKIDKVKYMPRHADNVVLGEDPFMARLQETERIIDEDSEEEQEEKTNIGFENGIQKASPEAKNQNGL